MVSGDFRGKVSLFCRLFGIKTSFRGYFSEGIDRYIFSPKNSCKISLAVDTVAPTVTLQQLNFTYFGSEVPMNFTVDEPILKAVYSLDGGENITTSTNLTLSGLVTGPHNVTVYAWDLAGNVGKS